MTVSSPKAVPPEPDASAAAATQANLDLHRWFTTQYPTVKERLRYIRRKSAEAARRPRIAR